jgi:hypothetical protein
MAETLDPRLVYAKTPAGVAEVGARSDTLSQGARRLLVLIDGRRPLAALPSTVRPGELPKLIQELLAGGLITLSGIVDELPPGGEMRDPRLEDFKRRIEGAVLRELGPSGSVLEARLQDCVNMTVLRSVMREIIDLVGTRAGEAASQRVAGAAQAANRAWAERIAAAARAGAAGAPQVNTGSPPGDAARPKGRDGESA